VDAHGAAHDDDTADVVDGGQWRAEVDAGGAQLDAGAGQGRRDEPGSLVRRVLGQRPGSSRISR
jgi:hypothetical protein